MVIINALIIVCAILSGVLIAYLLLRKKLLITQYRNEEIALKNEELAEKHNELIHSCELLEEKKEILLEHIRDFGQQLAIAQEEQERTLHSLYEKCEKVTQAQFELAAENARQ